MKVRAVVSDPQETEIDITFPVYRRHDVGHCTIYTCTVSAAREIDVTEYDTRQQYEIEVSKPSFFSGLDYLLGRGIYQCSPEAFWEALARAKVFISHLEAGQ